MPTGCLTVSTKLDRSLKEPNELSMTTEPAAGI